MKLASKVTLITALITLGATLSVGVLVLVTTYNTGLHIAREKLSFIVDEVASTTDDKLSFALLKVQSQEISLLFEQADGTETLIQEVPLTSATDSVEAQTLNLEDNEKLVFKIPLRDLNDNALSSGFLTLFMAVFAAALATLITRRLLNKDLIHINKLTHAADAISKGETGDLSGFGTSSEIAELSSALDVMVQRLQTSKDEMQDFLSDASHELRTPLTVVRGYLELLQANPALPEDQKIRALTGAHREAVRMQHLINDILTLAELGQMPIFQAAPVNITSLLQEQVDILKTFDDQRKITFKFSTDADIHGSKALLTQLFANIFSNIRNHTSPAAQVRVELSEVDEFLIIHIDDGGEGLPQLKTGQLLTEFRRFDASKSPKTGGSGLGLSIMARIVQLHKGSLELSQSELGGLRVSVLLPKS